MANNGLFNIYHHNFYNHVTFASHLELAALTSVFYTSLFIYLVVNLLYVI